MQLGIITFPIIATTAYERSIIEKGSRLGFYETHKRYRGRKAETHKQTGDFPQFRVSDYNFHFRVLKTLGFHIGVFFHFNKKIHTKTSINTINRIGFKMQLIIN
ncbi:hypothetical protein V8G54_009723 [Vigna mungo]|uniref:Uncharacterized protein n=1 Tax=Vigna mungo TaxID=3915 RepID=A0AAQ3S5R6_VIGMU